MSRWLPTSLFFSNMMKRRKTPYSSPSLKQGLLLLFLVTFVMILVMNSILTTEHSRIKKRSSSNEKHEIMDWQFSLENIQREPALYEMLSSFTLNPSSLKSLKLASPGVPGTTMLDFFGTNPGWLSQRTFTADVFTCPPNSHEGHSPPPHLLVLLTRSPRA